MTNRSGPVSTWLSGTIRSLASTSISTISLLPRTFTERTDDCATELAARQIQTEAAISQTARIRDTLSIETCARVKFWMVIRPIVAANSARNSPKGTSPLVRPQEFSSGLERARLLHVAQNRQGNF